jgi:hypothetical protein
MSEIYIVNILMALNALFYVAIIVVVNILSLRINKLKKEVRKWSEIEKLITVELKELINNFKNTTI